jgi:hypothetical protein
MTGNALVREAACNTHWSQEAYSDSSLKNERHQAAIQSVNWPKSSNWRGHSIQTVLGLRNLIFNFDCPSLLLLSLPLSYVLSTALKHSIVVEDQSITVLYFPPLWRAWRIYWADFHFFKLTYLRYWGSLPYFQICRRVGHRSSIVWPNHEYVYWQTV